MKRCAKCQEYLPLSSFWRSAKQHDGFQSYCKACSKKRRGEYYRDNREAEGQLRDEWNRAYRDWYISLKADTPCSQCGDVFHHAAMHWHHRDAATKTASVGTLASNRAAKETVLAEIAKCDLVCANCHAVLTWHESGCSSIG